MATTSGSASTSNLPSNSTTSHHFDSPSHNRQREPPWAKPKAKPMQTRTTNPKRKKKRPPQSRQAPPQAPPEKPPPPPPPPPPPSHTYPHLDPSIQDTLLPHAISPPWTFRAGGTRTQALRTYDTNVMGTFACPNTSCRQDGWSSKRVGIAICEFGGRRYNATVYSQRCQSCNKMGVLALHEQSYVERVSYRLKKWAGVSVEAPPFVEKKSPPHRRDLCEGCKRGFCAQSTRSEL